MSKTVYLKAEVDDEGNVIKSEEINVKRPKIVGWFAKHPVATGIILGVGGVGAALVVKDKVTPAITQRNANSEDLEARLTDNQGGLAPVSMTTDDMVTTPPPQNM